MLSVVRMLLKGEVEGCVLNSHGNYIVDHGKSWKNHEVDSGKTDEHIVPVCTVQGTPYIGPSISTHQLTAMPTDSLSLSSLSSGALTFPYSSTGFGAAASSQYRSLPIPDVQSQGELFIEDLTRVIISYEIY